LEIGAASRAAAIWERPLSLANVKKYMVHRPGSAGLANFNDISGGMLAFLPVILVQNQIFHLGDSPRLLLLFDWYEIPARNQKLLYETQ
jgi:hypothetical protein